MTELLRFADKNRAKRRANVTSDSMKNALLVKAGRWLDTLNPVLNNLESW
jgi:hypothetical protein